MPRGWDRRPGESDGAYVRHGSVEAPRGDSPLPVLRTAPAAAAGVSHPSHRETSLARRVQQLELELQSRREDSASRTQETEAWEASWAAELKALRADCQQMRAEGRETREALRGDRARLARTEAELATTRGKVEGMITDLPVCIDCILVCNGCFVMCSRARVG